MGYPTNFTAPNPDDNGTQLMQPIAGGPVNHMISVHSVRRFVESHLGFDITHTLQAADWLTFPMQKLRSLVSGAVYHDAIGLERMRARFAYYPHDVWLYQLAAGWARIGQEEHLMGRAGLVGDDIGSALIASRLVRDIMRLCFLMEKQYAPYPKWFGTAFRAVGVRQELWPVLRGVQLRNDLAGEPESIWPPPTQRSHVCTMVWGLPIPSLRNQTIFWPPVPGHRSAWL